MKRIEPYPIAVALGSVFWIFYAVCVGLHMVYPEAGTNWPMYRIWETVLWGFTWITPLSFLVGSIEIIFGGFYVAYILIPLYTYFNSRFPVKEGENAMRPLRFKPVAFAIAAFGMITYVICIVSDLIFPGWAMTDLWEVLLPGFSGLNWGSFFVGLIGIMVYGLYIGAVFVPIYNNFRGNDLPQVKS